MSEEKGLKEKGIIKGLFEPEFAEFVTPKIIRFLYLLSIILLFLSGIGLIGAGFSKGFMQGIGALILAIPVSLLVLCYIRVVCEFVIVVFKIAENTKKDEII